jgi:hypothetical protein
MRLISHFSLRDLAAPTKEGPLAWPLYLILMRMAEAYQSTVTLAAIVWSIVPSLKLHVP